MAYHTPLYLLLFLPLTLLVYQLTPSKKRWMVLLAASYLFFWSISGKLVLYLIGTTWFTYSVGLHLQWLRVRRQEELQGAEEKSAVQLQYKRKARWVLTAGILTLLAVLAYLKYYNFFVNSVNSLLEKAGSPGLLDAKTLLLPVGISFYTLQAIGYMADVYWEKIPAQEHLGKLALFLGFFPQIVEGPICLYSQTADNLWKGEPLRAENLARGLERILWGLFKKMVVADRLNTLVAAVFDHHEQYGGVVVAAAAVAYTVQLYMEFSGCMDLVIGSGRLFGVRLPENFRRPFASENAAEFWRRWHITLGAWLKTYVFYPVSVSSLVKKWNRFGKKHVGRYGAKLGVTALCLFPVWLCNGLWHGPRWSYLFFGMYYFVILLASAAIEPVRSRLIQQFHIRETAWYWRRLRIWKTWLIIFVGELFFRADGLRAGISMFRSIFQDFRLDPLWDGTMLTFGLDWGDYSVVLAGCLAVALVGKRQEQKQAAGLVPEEIGLGQLCLPVRWVIYYGLIFAILMLGAYGIGYQQVGWIYAGF